MASLSVFTLGSPRIEIDHRPVEVDTRKAIAMVIYLAVRGESHRRESLAALLWPEYDQTHAMGAMRRTLSALRKALGGEYLEIKRDSVGIQLAAQVWVDVCEFQGLIAECRTHGHGVNQVCPRCLPLLEQALQLYRDDFMAGFSLRDSLEFDDWQFFQREALRRDLGGVLERLVEGYSVRGDFPQAIQVARRQIALDPLDEPAHRQLMKLYAQAGQFNAALRQYQECYRILKDELGVTPLEETTRLWQMIKEQRIGSAAEAASVEMIPAALPVTPAPQIPMIARDEELASLHNVYRGIRENGYFLAIEGEAGIGKTRLAEELLARLRSSGTVVIAAQCYPGQAGMAYAPLVEGMRRALVESVRADWSQFVPPLWLNEAARLLPELSPKGVELALDTSLDSPGAHIRFYEGLTQVLLAYCGNDPPGVFFLDDLQWADEATLDFLTYLVRRLQGRPILILVTWSGEDLATGHRLRHLSAEAQRNGMASEVHLSRLSPQAVDQLVNTIAPQPGVDTHSLSDRLYQESEGLPFFIVEYLATPPSEIVQHQDETWSLPAGVRQLLRSRLDLVGDAGRQLLQTAAVIGRSFNFDTLREASGRTQEETVSTLEMLIARGLIRETPVGIEQADMRGLSYDFNHDKVRSLVYLETSLARRRLLHQRVAQALIAHAHGRHELTELAGQIAAHLKQGGLVQEAAEYYQLAGDHARLLHANNEALSSYQSALALGHPNPAELDEAIGDMQTLMGEYPAALRSYDTAGALYQLRLNDLARVEHKLGDLCARIGDWDMAEKHFRAATEALAGTDDPVTLSLIYADWSRMAHRQGQVERADQMALQALELAQVASNAAALAHAYNVMGILARSRGDLAMAISRLEDSLAVARQAGEPGAQIAALNNLSLAYADQDALDKAITRGCQALELCLALGDRHHEAALHNNIADLYHAAGQEEEAMDHLKQAVVIFTEIGDGSGERVSPEIWKLSEW
jgi:predicted ATPase/DNA-binding SARP family transcriptional activator